MAQRHCHATTKAGKPCKAAPLSDGDYCSAHDPNRPDEIRFGSPLQAAHAGASPKPRQPRVVEVMRERIEADIDRVLTPYFDALEHAVMHATFEGVVIVSDIPDLGARIAAAEKLLDRVYGKPRQAMEHSGPDRGAVPLELDESASRAAHEFLARIRRA